MSTAFDAPAVARPHPTLPSREVPQGTAPLRRLFDRSPGHNGDGARGGLGEALASAYDGDLWIDLHPTRPTVVTNFVSTLDGIVAMDRDGQTGGGEISGFSPTDRFVMGLLRALADIVLVGAGTVRGSSRGTWTPESVFPPAAGGYHELRSRLGLATTPTTMIATASGDLDPALPVFRDDAVPMVIAAPREAADRLRANRFHSNVAIETVDDGVGAAGVIDVADRIGARVVVSEAGPHLFGGLIDAGMVDDLFLTVAPQIAGRASGTDRLGLVEGTGLWPGAPTWASLASARVAGDHLFLRYQLKESMS